jgi:uncharacterized protein YlxW (UPF0749 family)
LKFSLVETIDQLTPYSQAIVTFITVVGVAFLFGGTIISLQKEKEINEEKLKSVRAEYDEKLKSVRAETEEKLKSVRAEYDEKVKTVKAESESTAIKNYLQFAHSEEYVTLRTKKIDKN